MLRPVSPLQLCPHWRSLLYEGDQTGRLYCLCDVDEDGPHTRTDVQAAGAADARDEPKQLTAEEIAALNAIADRRLGL